jgi:hypothetical protein
MVGFEEGQYGMRFSGCLSIKGEARRYLYVLVL